MVVYFLSAALQGCLIFLDTKNIMGKISQMTIKYTKVPQNKTIDHTVFQMVIKKISILPKAFKNITKFGVFV
jgi:hypothetical protein